MKLDQYKKNAGLILGLHPANEKHRYKVRPSLIEGHRPGINPENIFSTVGSDGLVF